MHSGLHAAASAAVFVTAAALTFGTEARAIEPDALPAAMWWQAPAPELSRDPLAALSLPGDFRLAAEWAPLYVSKDGSRYERAQRSFRLATPAGAWRGAVELGVRGSVARGGDQQAWFGAEGPLAATSTLAIGHQGPRHEFGAAASARDGRPGMALGGRTRFGLTRFLLGWSVLPQTGRSVVRWDDVDLLAEGRWVDQRVRWEIQLSPAEAVEIVLGQDALDRRAARPDAVEAGDRIEPSLAWRASHLSAALPAIGLQWRMSAEYGEGREGLRICRSRTPYVTASGPVFNGLATLEATEPRRRLALRAWAGRWNGDARAAVALWAFEELAAISGTRRVAHSSATLEHRGFAIDRTPPERGGVDGGLALWSLAPRASYQSWQATVMGVGRDDASEGETTLRSALALGARIAGTIEWRGARARLELVQWIPVRLVQEQRSPETGPPAPWDPGEAGSADRGARGARGGSILRFSIGSGAAANPAP